MIKLTYVDKVKLICLLPVINYLIFEELRQDDSYSSYMSYKIVDVNDFHALFEKGKTLKLKAISRRHMFDR